MEFSCLLPRFPSILVFLFFLLLSKAIHSSSQQCLSQTFPKGRSFDHCKDLPELGAVLHWSFNPSNSSLDIAFVAPPATLFSWVSWVLNPDAGQGTVDAQTLFDFWCANGGMTIEAFNLTNHSFVPPSPISIEVSKLYANFSGVLMGIFITIEVSPRRASTNHIWQVRRSMVGSKGNVHGFNHQNLRSKGRLDLQPAMMISASTTVGLLVHETSTSSTNALEKIHGLLCGVSWGILLPISATLAMFKPADNSAWFYARVICQSFAYIIGIVGLFIGVYIGSQSFKVVYPIHQSITWVLQFLCSLQVAIHLWKPKEEDKAVWNFLHKLLGIILCCLGVANVFIGLNILKAGESWRRAYISLLVIIGLLFCLLKVFLIVRNKNMKIQTPNGPSTV